MGDLKTYSLLVAVITDTFLKKTDLYLEHCSNGVKLNKPMYAIVKNGVNWDKFKHFPWRKIYFFNDEVEYSKAWEDMKKDRDFFEKVQKFSPPK